MTVTTPQQEAKRAEMRAKMIDLMEDLKRLMWRKNHE
jgi:hypothetical protein